MKSTYTQQKQSSILIRIPQIDKNEATEILDKLGITLTQSFYMFVKALINERGIPFSLKENEDLWRRVDKIKAIEKICSSFDPKSINTFDIKNEEQLQTYITAERRKKWK